jgi:hypothetical protein
MPKTSRSRADAEAGWDRGEAAILAPLSTPIAIQGFIDSVAYSDDPIYRSPRSVLRDRKAHCLDGAMFAAAALRRLGHPPLLVDLRAERDDDHVLAVFAARGHWGALAQSNFVGLRYREPIHRTIRELALSYFEVYYNVLGEKTLRAYSQIFDLRRFDHLEWMTQDTHLETIVERLDRVRHFPLISKKMVATLERVDERSLQAGLLGCNPKGLYKPQ